MNAVPTVVTISASYGAGGSVIGPQVSERLDVQFVDRAIPAAVSDRMAVPVAEAIAQEEPTGRILSRILASFAQALPVVAGAALPAEALSQDPDEFRLTREQVLREYAAGGAVILGRAAAIVLKDVAHALHVRLDGPRERRVQQAMRHRGVDQETAESQLEAADRSRAAYVHHWYRESPTNPALYHLMIDSTVIDVATCVDLIALAFEARVAGAG